MPKKYFVNKEDKFSQSIALKAIGDDFRAFEKTSAFLKRNKEFVLKAIDADNKGLVVSFLGKEFLKDRDVILAAAKKNGFQALHKGDNSFKDDDEIAYQAVKQDGTALQFLSERLKKDISFCARALASSSSAFRYFDPSIKYELNTMLAIYEIWIPSYLALITQKELSQNLIDKVDNYLKEHPKTNDYYTNHLIRIDSFASKVYKQSKFEIEPINIREYKDTVFILLEHMDTDSLKSFQGTYKDFSNMVQREIIMRVDSLKNTENKLKKNRKLKI